MARNWQIHPIHPKLGLDDNPFDNVKATHSISKNIGEKRSYSIDYTTSKSAECGDIIGADLHFSWDGNHQDAICKEEIFGKIFNGHRTKSEDPQEPIPDNDTSGLTRILHIPALNAITTKLVLSINIEHSLPGDLTVTLTAPNGNTVTVFHDPNSLGPNLVGSYSINGFIGTDTGGDYSLHIVDSYPYDTGQLQEWSIDVEYVSYQCRTWEKDKILQYILGYYEEEDVDKMDTNIDQDINISDFIYSLNY